MKHRDLGDLCLQMGHPVDEEAVQRLLRYGTWLIEEAIPAGGLGPNETDRVEDRHLVDSLLFSRYLDGPETLWDLGSGVGLPGIPLSIVMPDTAFVLIDRSQRRVDLMRRAVRVLDLDNVTVEMDDIGQLSGSADVIVSRAVSSPSGILSVAHRHLRSGGVALVGGSWVGPPRVAGWETVDAGSGWLDRPVWLLMMRHS